MDIIELFESPLPELTTDIEKITVETSGNYEGSFIVKNTGGGELMGNILSNSGVIKFTPSYFNSKKTTVFYTLDISILKPGDVITTSVVIMSNGGEKIIPVTIKILPFCIETKENIKIATLKDFYRYAKKHPVSARQIFMTHDFSVWLTGISYPYMDSYEKLAVDPNKERALDNFFIISKLKKQAFAEPIAKDITVTVNPYKDKSVEGFLEFKRQSWGYTEEAVKLVNEKKWITLSKDKLTSADFDENNTAKIGYTIKPYYVTEKTDFEKITVGGNFIMFYVKKTPPLSGVLSDETFTSSKRGYVLVTNNTGRDLTIEVSVSDNSVKFESARFLISSFAKIPFDIKLPVAVSAQFLFKRRPSISAEIFISNAEYKFRKRLRLQIAIQ
jgi:hypothetical protein